MSTYYYKFFFILDLIVGVSIGYTTSGALRIEVTAIPQLPPKWVAPAYRLHCQATKLACRDIIARKLGTLKKYTDN